MVYVPLREYLVFSIYFSTFFEAIYFDVFAPDNTIDPVLTLVFAGLITFFVCYGAII
jgi:hypothetical protein